MQPITSEEALPAWFVVGGEAVELQLLLIAPRPGDGVVGTLMRLSATTVGIATTVLSLVTPPPVVDALPAETAVPLLVAAVVGAVLGLAITTAGLFRVVRLTRVRLGQHQLSVGRWSARLGDIRSAHLEPRRLLGLFGMRVVVIEGRAGRTCFRCHPSHPKIELEALVRLINQLAGRLGSPEEVPDGLVSLVDRPARRIPDRRVSE